MHYYKRNIGDYAKKAGRLSMLEHGAYTLLIDACYDRERFPTEAEAIDWAWARSDAEIEAVRFVLSRFFVLTDGLYVQDRINDEVVQYQRNAETNARIATEREEKRRSRERFVNGSCNDVNEPPPNQEPLTKNQEPRTKEVREEASPPQPAAPQKQKAKPATTLKTYLSRCRELAEKPVPEGHSIRKWARDAGITDEMLQIAWVKFKERYTEAEKGVAKSYKDWPSHFATSVKDNWFGVWFFGDDGLQWSSKGMTFRSVMDQQTRGGNEQG